MVMTETGLFGDTWSVVVLLLGLLGVAGLSVAAWFLLIAPTLRIELWAERALAGEEHKAPDAGPLLRRRAERLGQAAARRLSSEEHRQSVFASGAMHAAAAALMVADRDSRILSVNRSMRRFLVERQDEMRALGAAIDPDRMIGARLDTLLDQLGHRPALPSEPSHLPLTIAISRGGLEIELVADAVLDAKGAHIGTVFQWHDVTRERQSAQALDAIERTQLLVEFDMSGKVVAANQTYLDAAGLSEAEALGLTDAAFPALDADEGDDSQRRWRTLRDGEMVAARVEQTSAPAGRRIFDMRFLPIVDSTKKPVRVLAMGTDVTETVGSAPRCAEDHARIADLETVVGGLGAAIKALACEDLNCSVEVPFSAEYEEIRTDLDTAVAFVRRTVAQQEASEREQGRAVLTLAAALKRLAAGDLTQTLDAPFAERYEPLRHDFNAAVENLSSTVGGVASVSGGIMEGATEVAQSNANLARRTEHQAMTLERAASALEEIAVTVAQSAEHVSEVDETVSSVLTQADLGSQTVQRAISAMAAIETSSGEIGKIIQLIDEVAFQTNLLALNAGVEAARAGDAGRGFAVVAQEVRGLAQRSAEAAREIAALISTSSVHVSDGAKLVREAGDALTGVVTAVGTISELASGLSRSSAEQSSAVNEVNDDVRRLDDVTRQNTAMVEETAAAGQSLHMNAERLLQLVSVFQLSQSQTAQEHSGTRAA